MKKLVILLTVLSIFIVLLISQNITKKEKSHTKIVGRNTQTIWKHTFNKDSTEKEINHISITKDSSIIITGYLKERHDRIGWISKLNQDGTVEWSREYKDMDIFIDFVEINDSTWIISALKKHTVQEIDSLFGKEQIQSHLLKLNSDGDILMELDVDMETNEVVCDFQKVNESEFLMLSVQKGSYNQRTVYLSNNSTKTQRLLNQDLTYINKWRFIKQNRQLIQGYKVTHNDTLSHIRIVTNKGNLLWDKTFPKNKDIIATYVDDKGTISFLITDIKSHEKSSHNYYITSFDSHGDILINSQHIKLPPKLSQTSAHTALTSIELIDANKYLFTGSFVNNTKKVREGFFLITNSKGEIIHVIEFNGEKGESQRLELITSIDPRCKLLSGIVRRGFKSYPLIIKMEF